MLRDGSVPQARDGMGDKLIGIPLLNDAADSLGLLPFRASDQAQEPLRHNQGLIAHGSLSQEGCM